MKHQYFYRRAECKAANHFSQDCICWYDEGTGPHKDHRPNTDCFRSALAWRIKGTDQAYVSPKATPKTDAKVKHMRANNQDPDGRDPEGLEWFARDLECELTEANARIKALIAERDTARLSAEKQWNLRSEFERVLGTVDVAEGVNVVKVLKERIKRLEEAGDAVESDKQTILRILRDFGAAGTLGNSSTMQWNQAKEDKQ